MKTQYDTVISLLRTEKSTGFLPLNKYLFLVDRRSNKLSIKQAVEQIYKVKVAKVNTAIASGKAKRVRFKLGRTADWKKAVVSLKQGYNIEVT